MISINTVATQCDRFRQATGVAVSPHSVLLITDILGAILSDPHAGWRASAEERERFAYHLVEILPEFLNQMYQQSGWNHVITSFDVIHFMSAELQALCPFEKVSHRRKVHVGTVI